MKIKTALEVAGPPGSEKIKTIVELVRSLLECTECNIVILSERNGAINTIADKFVESYFFYKGNGIPKIIGMSVWHNLVTGAGE